MKRVANVLAAIVLASVTTYASAACRCSCVNGQIEAVCALPSDLPPVCAPRACTVKQPSATLTRVAGGTTKLCHETLVLNPQTGSYLSKQVCQ